MKEAFTIDFTPTWPAQAQTALTILENTPSEEAKKIAKDEILRMAKIAEAGKNAANTLLACQSFLAQLPQADLPNASKETLQTLQAQVEKALNSYPQKKPETQT